MSLLFVDISINVLTIQSSAIFSLSIFVVKFPATLEPPTCSRPFLFQSFLSRPVPLLHYPSYISVYFLSCCLLHLRFTPCFYHLFFSIIFYVHYLFKVSFLSLPDVVVFFQDCSSRIFYLLTLVHWYLVIIDSSASQCESFFFALLCRQPQFHTRLWMPLPCLCHFSFSWFICHLVSLDCILAPVCIPQLHIQCFTITITFPPSVPFYKIINPFFLVYQMLFPTPLWLFRFNTLLVPPSSDLSRCSLIASTALAAKVYLYCCSFGFQHRVFHVFIFFLAASVLTDAVQITVFCCFFSTLQSCILFSSLLLQMPYSPWEFALPLVLVIFLDSFLLGKLVVIGRLFAATNSRILAPLSFVLQANTSQCYSHVHPVPIQHIHLNHLLSTISLSSRSSIWLRPTASKRVLLLIIAEHTKCWLSKIVYLLV